MNLKSIKWRMVAPILVIGLIIILLQQYTSMAKELNISWSNGSSEFAKVTSWFHGDVKGLQDPEDITIESVNYALNNGSYQTFHQQLEMVTLLPYGHEIVPFRMSEKLRELANYQLHVLHVMKKELEDNGKVSGESVDRIRSVNLAWEKFSRVFSEEHNKPDPFSPIFLKGKWQQVWSKAVLELDEVDLVPIPDDFTETLG